MGDTVTNRQKLTLGWRGKTARLPDITFDDVTEPAPPPALRTPHVVSITAFDEPTPLQICPGHWRNWMGQSERDLGAKGQVGIKNGSDDEEHKGYDNGAAAAEAAAARASREIAMATDAMIESLPRHFKAAIYMSCSISTVWSFPKMNFEATLPEAQAELTAKLAKNMATRAFF